MGVMDRLVLSDEQWGRISGRIIGRPDQRGSTGRDNRMFVEGVLWIVRTGSPWRDLPEAFGEWNSVFRRFSRWSRKGVWQRIFAAMSDDHDFEYLSTPPSYAPTSTPAALKGGSKSGNRTFARRPNHQNSSRRQRARLPGPLPPHRWPGWRCATGCRPA